MNDLFGFEQSLKAIGAEGLLTEEDLEQLKGQRRKVWDLMRDSHWHTGPEIVAAAGGSEGLRRLRELRRLSHIEIEKWRIPNSRTWAYRLVRRPKCPRP